MVLDVDKNINLRMGELVAESDKQFVETTTESHIIWPDRSERLECYFAAKRRSFSPVLKWDMYDMEMNSWKEQWENTKLVVSTLLFHVFIDLRMSAIRRLMMSNDKEPILG